MKYSVNIQHLVDKTIEVEAEDEAEAEEVAMLEWDKLNYDECGEYTTTVNEVKPLKCKDCNGFGRLLKPVEMGGNRVQDSMDCPKCKGTGIEKIQVKP